MVPGLGRLCVVPAARSGGWVSVVVVLAIDSLVHVYEVDGAELAKRERLRVGWEMSHLLAFAEPWIYYWRLRDNGLGRLSR